MTPNRPFLWIQSIGEPVAELDFSPDAGFIIAGGVEGQVSVVYSSAGERRHTWLAHPGGLFHCALSIGGTLATSGQDGEVRIWDWKTGKSDLTLKMSASWVENMAWSPDGRWIAATAGKFLRFWQPATGVVHDVPPSKTTWTSLCWNSIRLEVAAARFGAIELWQANSGEHIQTLDWSTSLISVTWAPDGNWLAAGTQELSVQIWPVPFRPERDSELAMSGYAAKVRQFAWHYSGRFLATGGGNDVMVWDFRGKGPEGTTPRILTGHLQKVSVLAHQKSGHLLASGGADGLVLLWNVGKTSGPLEQYQLSGPITALAWNFDGTALAVGSHAGEVALIRI